MAKKEEETYPAYIDYEGSDVTNPVETWGTSQFEKYWGKLLTKHHRAAAHPFAIKDKTLLKRMIAEFGEDSLRKMMEHFIVMTNLEKASQFWRFYQFRHTIFEQTQPKDYTWD